MRKLLTFLIALAVWSGTTASLFAQMMFFQPSYLQPPPAYTGPGDIVSGATIWGSCARVLKASLASTSTNLCDLVAVTGGAAVGTLRASATGFVDLSAYFSGSVTPATACAAASGGSCKVTKVYNQVSPGTLDFTEATLGNMPALTFSALGGLPGMTFVSSNSSQVDTTATSFTQPFSMSAVYERTSNFTASGTVLAGTGSGQLFGPAATASTGGVGAPAPITATATDSTFIGLQGSFNGAVTCNVQANSNTNSGNCGTGAITSAAMRVGRSTNGTGLDGVIMETGAWSSVAFSTTQEDNLNTNQHSATSGYNF